MDTHRPFRLHRFIHAVVVRPHLALAAGVAVAVYLLLPGHWRSVTRLIDAWLVFVALYVAFVLWMMRQSTVAAIRKRAALYDVGAGFILLLALGASIASLGAVVAEIADVRQSGTTTLFFLSYCTLTVALSWSFVHIMFALHYAHDYYTSPANVHPALEFPGESEPDYSDFLYFSFVIGCAFATADVNIRSREIRRLALIHGIVAFFFNAAIVALLINLAAGLLGS